MKIRKSFDMHFYSSSLLRSLCEEAVKIALDYNYIERVNVALSDYTEIAKHTADRVEMEISKMYW